MSDKKDLTSIFETKPVDLSSTENAPQIIEDPSLSSASLSSPIDGGPTDPFVLDAEDAPVPALEKTAAASLPEFSAPDFSQPNASPTEAPPAPDALASIKSFAESVPLGSAQASPAFPYHLLIEGELDIHDRTRLVDLINRHDMGIREVDLEPQFESGRVLIPRISEYAVVLITQALRSSSATLFASPSDRAEELTNIGSSSRVEVRVHDAGSDSHPADSIPVTQDHRISGAKTDRIVDVIMTGASLKAASIDIEHSSEYNELLDALKTELKYRAHRKGANGVVNFKVAISYSDATQTHKIVVSGTAIKTSPQSN